MEPRDEKSENCGLAIGKGRLFNFRPALFAAAFFALGIAFSYARLVKGASFLWLLSGLPLSAATLLFSKKRLRAFFTLCVFAFVFSAGAASFALKTESFLSGGVYFGENVVAGTVAEKFDYGSVVVIRLENPLVSGNREKGALVATLSPSEAENIDLADEVVFTAKISTVTGIEGEEYDFSNGVRYRASAANVVVTGKSGNLFLLARRRLRTALYSGMDEETAAVTYAVLTGDTSGIDGGLLENVRRGGVAHIFAVSGLHVGALYAFCRVLFDKTRLKGLPPVVKWLSLTALLVFYGGVCGFSASVVRATVMCLLAYASALIGIKSDMLENTGAAAFLLLAFDPSSLFGTGFRLSFAACLSIGVSARPLSDGLKKILPFTEKGDPDKPTGIPARIGRSAIGFLSVTIAAQIGSAPVLLDAFGYLSLWGLLLNCAFVPLIGGIFALLLIFAVVAAVFPAAAGVVLYPPAVLWNALLLVFHAADFSASLFSGVKIGAAAVLYYAGVLLFSDKIRLPRRRKILFCALCFVLFGIAVYAING